MRDASGWLGAAAWALLCLRWFDVAAPWRPGWLQALPPMLLALPCGLALALGLVGLRRRLAADGERAWLGLALVLALTLGLRLPLVREAAAGYLTADGALSGIVALRLRDAREHFVFVPAVPYSGSLKSHLAAPLAALIDPAQAFALASLLFYAAFAAGAHRLGLLAGGRAAAFWAGLYVALAPAFVTQYSLSNDGNYVEVLAFGAWACVTFLAWSRDPARPGVLMLTTGLLLGLAFWCHILALIPALAVGLGVLAAARWRTARPAGQLLAGWALGYLPGLLWNAANRGESFRYLLPGLQPVGEAAASAPAERLLGLLRDHAPLLMGYVPSDSPVADWLAFGLAAGGALSLAWALGRSLLADRHAPGADARALRGLLVLIDLALVTLALPYIPGNPRYLVLLMIAAPALLAWACGRGRGRLWLGALLALGCWGSAGQAWLKRDADRQWRGLAADLERLGVRHCYSDFYLATKLNFLTAERVVCSAKLGPTLTEYFFEYRRAVDEAPSAAYVAVNHAQADKLERRLQRLGVSYERHDGMKPVLYDLARKVDPQELFPDRSFPLR